MLGDAFYQNSERQALRDQLTNWYNGKEPTQQEVYNELKRQSEADPKKAVTMNAATDVSSGSSEDTSASDAVVKKNKRRGLAANFRSSRSNENALGASDKLGG